jgi:hypothetical protein
MAVVLTPLGKAVVGISKWLVVPVIVGYIGYAFIGPRIGAKDPKDDSAAKARAAKQNPKSERGKEFQDIRTN